MSRGMGALQRKIIYWEGETPYIAYTNFVKVIVDFDLILCRQAT